jgi:adenosine deaminase
LRRLFDAGVAVSINTDDPAVCGTTLEDEYAFARRHAGFTDAELLEVNRRALGSAFR